MFRSRDNIIRVLESLIEDIRRDFIETQRDTYVGIRRQVYNEYYRVAPISPRVTREPIAFVDAGFIPYHLDVSIIIPIQLGAYIRITGETRLKTVKDVLGKPVTDNLLLYSSRMRRGNKYLFTLKIKSFQEESLLFDKDNPCDEATSRINNVLRELGGLEESRTPRFFAKLTKYVEGLLELAYTVKLIMKIEENGGLEEPLHHAVLDGTLIKWFSVKTQKRLRGLDGLDILAAILNLEPEKIKKYLYRIVGLSKTTKFTNVIRSQALFYTKTGRDKMRSGAYALVNTRSLDNIRSRLNDLLDKYALTDFVSETLKIFNRVVYNLHNIYAARFPITTDYRNIFMIDLYSDAPIIWLDSRKRVEVSPSQAENINERVTRIINALYSHRTRTTGEAPYGYMEVDVLVRLTEQLRSLFENTLLAVLRRYDDLTSRILEQIFSPTTRMRYGYR